MEGARLSNAEMVVMRVLCGGDSVAEAAKKLNKSPSTISTHIRRVKVKLGARSTIQAAIMWATGLNNGDMEYLSWSRAGK